MLQDTVHVQKDSPHIFVSLIKIWTKRRRVNDASHSSLLQTKSTAEPLWFCNLLKQPGVIEAFTCSTARTKGGTYKKTLHACL